MSLLLFAETALSESSVPYDLVDDSSELQTIEFSFEVPATPVTEAPSVGSLQVSNQSWPSEIKCEMNIEEWSRALQEANLLPEFSDVLLGFQEGFNQGIPQHSLGPNLPFFTPPNHASAWEAHEKIEEKLQKELREGRMFGPFSHQEVQLRFPFFHSNPLGAVINGNGSFRPTNDLSYPHGRPDVPSVNSFVNADDFLTTWDDFNIVSSFLRQETQPVHLAIFDWEKAYRQIPTAMDQWPFLMIQDFDGNLLLDTRITFGGVAGCGSFGRSADAWKLIMLHDFDLITIFRWVDDNLFVKRIDSQTSMESIVARSNRLGVKTNEEKFSPFSPEQKFIGFLWNGINKTVRLPDGKLFDRVDQVKMFLAKTSFHYKDVEIMVGRLNHVSYMLPQMRCYLCSCYRWLKSWRIRESLRDLPLDVKEDLEQWFHVLVTFQPTRLMPNPAPTEIGWFQLKSGWSQFKNQDGGIAWLETVAIRLGLSMLESLGIKQGKTFIVWTDNTTTEGVIRKRKSNDKSVNEEWKLIQDTLVKLQADIESRRVTSAENPADALSRGIRDGHEWRHVVPIEVPFDLQRHLFQVLF
ncbi:hypothetical protein PSTG_01269 [Puccinia striiformis f. sp. tritici PST-78]|uniref:Reverse transcriptase domain-containing protein n=1 Tax=Puccinia striiformis f. sp. tritici PST-78 TaxID=1165861 RepID=A0A0L0W1U1_9BASI|nr:hypothetical protein PSTG_01269 [Puccinia striiformis f. sp. tritici PST-78]